MELSPIWFIEPSTDEEYHRYQMLAYLQEVKEDFKLHKISKFLEDVRYHAKNIECFVSTRQCLETKERKLTDEQAELFKKVTRLPDDDPQYVEMMNTVKYAHKKLQKTLKEGANVWKRIENDLNVFFIGEQKDIHQGFVIIQYAESPVVEAYKFNYNIKSLELVFKSVGHHESGDKTFKDVRSKLLSASKMADAEALFIGVRSSRAYNTKESVLPVLKQMLVSRVFQKNVIGLLGMDF